MNKRLLLAAAAVLFTACEHGIDMTGTVVAPPDVQQLFSAEAPGQLFVVATVPAEPHELRDDAATVFCMPAGQARSISVWGFGHACATSGQAQVTAYVVPRTTEQIDCAGEGSVRPQSHMYGPSSFEPDDALAIAKVDAPIQVEGSGCADGHITFTLTLSPIAAPSGS